MNKIKKQIKLNKKTYCFHIYTKSGEWKKVTITSTENPLHIKQNIIKENIHNIVSVTLINCYE